MSQPPPDQSSKDDLLNAFAITLVKEYRLFLLGKARPREETSRLFGCSPFATNLSKCNFALKKMRERGEAIPDENVCASARHHFFLCAGSILCPHESERYLKCVSSKGATSAGEAAQFCPYEHRDFYNCFETLLEKL